MVNIQNLTNVDGYEAGRNGNLLVARDDNLQQSTIWQTAKGEMHVQMDICAVCVTDPATQDWLDQFVDDFTSVDYVIVVNERFLRKMSQHNKKICLYYLNRKVARNMEIVERGEPIFIEEEVASNARIDTYAKYKKFWAKRALKKMRKTQTKSENKIARKVRKEYRKNNRKPGLFQNMSAAPANAMSALTQNFKIDEPEDSSDEQAAANLEALENSMAAEPTPAPQPAPAQVAPEPVPAS